MRDGTKTDLDSIYRKSFQSFVLLLLTVKLPGIHGPFYSISSAGSKGCVTLRFQPELGLLIVFNFGQMTKVQIAGTVHRETIPQVSLDTNYQSLLGQWQG